MSFISLHNTHQGDPFDLSPLTLAASITGHLAFVYLLNGSTGTR